MFLLWSLFPRSNNCSPFFWLFEYVEILLFGAILKGQNAKKKKTADEKNLSPNISTVRALEKIIETDLRSYSAGLPFSFFFTF